MKDKIKVGMFDYLNVKPVYHNIEDNLMEFADITKGTPSGLNNLLSVGELDISPVSSFAYALNSRDWMIVPDLSISCDGDVLSVLYCSDIEFLNMDKKRVMITDESASAASLLKLLFYRSRVYPLFFKGDVSGGGASKSNGMLVIGDKALLGNWDEKFKYVYDLGRLWKSDLDLPFVFGLWAVRKKAYVERKKEMDSIISLMLENRDKNLKDKETFSEEISMGTGIDKKLLSSYFSAVHYDLCESKQKGLEAFYELLHLHKMIPEKVNLEFIDGV